MNRDEFNTKIIDLIKYINFRFPNGCNDEQCSKSCILYDDDGLCTYLSNLPDYKLR